MDIGKIQNISKAYEPEKAKKAGKNEQIEASSSDKSDEVFISNNAQSAYKDLKLMNLVKKLPESRAELVTKAKEKVSNGKVFSKNNIEQTAEKLSQGL